MEYFDYSNADPDTLVTCPFDEVHRVRVGILVRHLIKCQKVSHLCGPPCAREKIYGTIAFVHKKNRELMHAMYDISFIVASAVSTCLYSNTITPFTWTF